MSWAPHFLIWHSLKKIPKSTRKIFPKSLALPFQEKFILFDEHANSHYKLVVSTSSKKLGVDKQLGSNKKEDKIITCELNLVVQPTVGVRKEVVNRP